METGDWQIVSEGSDVELSVMTKIKAEGLKIFRALISLGEHLNKK